MREILDIVYASDHAYLFCCCVSVWSLMEQLPPRQQVRLHLLSDDSLCDEDERLLSHLSDRFSNLYLIRHNVAEKAFEQRDFSGSIWSKAACYRLILPELLRDVDLCLYLDSDTLIVGDITPLWDVDMTDFCLAGVFDDIASVRRETVGHSIPGIQTYVNSGVLLMNLRRMRERGVQEQLLAGVGDYLVVDQDLLNVVCYGAIRLLPSGYNCIPGVHTDSPRILHFLMRDYLRPWKNLRAPHSVDWWRCAEEFRSVFDVEAVRVRAYWYQRGSIFSIFRRCADFTNIFVVGSGGDAQRIFRALRLGSCKGLRGIVREEERLPYGEDTLLICASRKKDVPALEAFLSHEGGERQIFCYSRWPISFYQLMPKECAREVYGEGLMWEFGVDSRSAATVPALLEWNAARNPDRAALVEWRSGKRRSCTYRELNTMANRMADALRLKLPHRGVRVKLPGLWEWSVETLAAVLGIWKRGCVLSLSEEGTFMADFSYLTAERYSPAAPRMETLPEECALEAEGETLTQRALCGRAEDLRRRLGWHAHDTLLLCSPAPGEGLAEWIAALSRGNTAIMVSRPHPDTLVELSRREKPTIVGMSGAEFERISRELDKWTGREEAVTALNWRMVLTKEAASRQGDEEVSEGYSQSLHRWHRLCPHIPVNGQGYDGSFSYDCEWY